MTKLIIFSVVVFLQVATLYGFPAVEKSPKAKVSLKLQEDAQVWLDDDNEDMMVPDQDMEEWVQSQDPQLMTLIDKWLAVVDQWLVPTPDDDLDDDDDWWKNSEDDDDYEEDDYDWGNDSEGFPNDDYWQGNTGWGLEGNGESDFRPNNPSGPYLQLAKRFTSV